MNILHLISSSGFYGAENVVATLARELEQMGHRVSVATFENRHCPENNVVEQMVAHGVNPIRIPCRGIIDPETVGIVRQVVSNQRIDIVHTHGYKADVYGYIACHQLNIPLVATCHNWTKQTFAVRVYEYLDRLFLRRFDHVIAVSEAVAAEASRSGIESRKISVIYNGVDVAIFESAQAINAFTAGNRLTIGTASRLVAKKGIDCFLRAAQRVIRTFPNCFFMIVGEGPERATLEQLARELEIDQFVVFTGPRNDMPRVYASMEVFVLASLDEGMPMVLLEALSSGRPVVATDVGAVSKLVCSDRTGFLVKSGNPDELADKIMRLARDRELRARLGAEGRTKVREHFSSSAMCKSYSAIYKRLSRGNSAVKLLKPTFE